MKIPEKSLSVIVPVFNEEKTVALLLKKVLKRKEVLEIIIVNDGSTDRTLARINELKNRKIKVINHKKNQGQGAALRTGLKNFKGKWAIFQDADLELFPSDYPKLMVSLVEKRADFVIGNRWPNHKGYFLAKLGNLLATILVNICFNSRYLDVYCGYKIASMPIWRSLNLKSERFELSPEIAAKVALKKYRVDQVVVNYQPRLFKHGKKIKTIDLFKGFRKILAIRFGFDF